MARIEQVNVDGTNYDVGKLASTTAPGVVQVGSGLGVTSAGVLSANVTSVNGSTGAVTINVPAVNDATLTIQKNGTNVQTFTANQSTNATANITVPTKTSDLTNDSNFVESSDLATVATSGSYNDLSNKPTIPTVNNATLTIQKNGTTVKTFTANASSNVTANITVPTQTSELTNNSGFLTSSTGVTSFNGNTGAVTYTAPVTSVNGNTGAVTGLQTTGNLVTSVSSSSTNSQYPSAKLFYDTVGDVESVLQTLNSGTGV